MCRDWLLRYEQRLARMTPDARAREERLELLMQEHDNVSLHHEIVEKSLRLLLGSPACNVGNDHINFRPHRRCRCSAGREPGHFAARIGRR